MITENGNGKKYELFKINYILIFKFYFKKLYIIYFKFRKIYEIYRGIIMIYKQFNFERK